MNKITQQIIALTTVMLLAVSSFASDGLLTDDTYTGSVATVPAPAGNLTVMQIAGANCTGVNTPGCTGWVNFALSTLPPGLHGTDIAKAMLVVYVNRVAAMPAGGGILDASLVMNGKWTEGTLCGQGAQCPAGTTPTSALTTSVVIAKAPISSTAGQFVAFDVTSAVQTFISPSL